MMMLKRLCRAVMPDLLYAGIRRVYYACRFVCLSILIKTRTVFNLPQKKPLSKIRFTIYLADHCNLNCAGCNNYSPIAEPALLRPEDIEPDIKRMGELFNHECLEIVISGGETLLNPEAPKFMEILRENFPEGRIMFITNGILLPNQNDKFWRACHDNNITVWISHYPIHIDIQKIKDKARQFDAKVAWAWSEDTIIVNDAELQPFWKEPLDVKGTGDKNANFANCYKGNWCIALHEGHLYSCSRAMCIRHFNKRFGFNIFYPEDMIDIYKETDGKKILRKLAMPLEFCKHCDLKYQDVEWHVSKQDINEWI